MKTIIYSHQGRVHKLQAIDAEAVKQLVPAGAPFREIPQDEPPCPTDPNEYFFDAWALLEGGLVELDMAKAAQIRLNQIRGIRNERLKELDTEQIIALGRGDAAKVAEVESKKQSLRDIPQKLNFSSAKNAYDLRHIIPPELV